MELNGILKMALVRQTARPRINVFSSCSDLVFFHFLQLSHLFRDSSGTEPIKRTPQHTKPANSSEKDSANPMLEKWNRSSRKASKTAFPEQSCNYPSLTHSQAFRIYIFYPFVHRISPPLPFWAEASPHGLGLETINLIIPFDPLFFRND